MSNLRRVQRTSTARARGRSAVAILALLGAGILAGSLPACGKADEKPAAGPIAPDAPPDARLLAIVVEFRAAVEGAAGELSGSEARARLVRVDDAVLPALDAAADLPPDRVAELQTEIIVELEALTRSRSIEQALERPGVGEVIRPTVLSILAKLTTFTAE